MRATAKSLLSTFDRALARLDRRAIPAGAGPAPIFILGLPRSGTTLLYQVLVPSFRVAYLNNLLARLPRSAALVARIARVQHWRAPHSFRSDYGDTPGLNGPSEAGDFWDLVFPWESHHTVDPEEMTPARIEFLRRTVRSLSDLFNAPFLAKNTWHSLRIRALDQALPGSLFLIVDRDPLMVAQSLLRGRRAQLGEAPGPWSIRPRELEGRGDLGPVEYVGHQIAYTLRAIRAAQAALGRDRFLTIPYERLCRDTAGTRRAIWDFCAGRGTELRGRSGPPPGPFLSRGELALPSEEIRRLGEIFATLD